MPGETNLNQLLKTMQPRLNADPFTLCTLAANEFTGRMSGLLPAVIGLFREAEGVTLILPVTNADAQALSGNGAWALITLSVHSDLHAVGFLARLTTQLAAAGISVNAVSAFYHDHLFVPWADRDLAMQLLLQMTADA